MKIPFARPIIKSEEVKAAIDVLNSTCLVHGPKLDEFEFEFAKWTNSASVLALSNCTSGLHLAYVLKGIGPGDEVICPAMSHVATSHAIEFTGAKPVFIDSEGSTGNIDIDLIEKNINHKTKAITVVHFLGIPVEMQKICSLAEKYNLHVVEDCALAFGSKYKGTHVGLLGDIGVFSMYPAKHMTTLEGGLLVSKTKKHVERLKLLRAFGVDRNYTDRKVPGQYEVECLGYNYRMNDLQAAIGIQQLKKLHGFLKERKKNYDLLESELLNCSELQHFTIPGKDLVSSNYCKSILIKDKNKYPREKFVSYLNSKGIGTSVYYPKPIPHFNYYRKKYGYSSDSFPVATFIAENSIALPVGPHVTSDDCLYIADHCKKFLLYSNKK